MIRSQKTLDVATQELIAKLFQIILFAVIFILALQVLGLDLTAVTVFGGALAVGIGFGLQQIASNFISGIILLIERNLTVGDYIELEDGRGGILKELNMRSTTLETYDGKEIMVPNEKFITGVFINWTRDDPRQRYEVEFSVSYDTDITNLPEMIVQAALKHPKVLDDPEMPDCELREFGDSGIKFALEFWIEGIDDGKNRISADLLTIIWQTLRENGIKIPYPQREVRVISNDPIISIKKKP
jgi:small-conductance mechanosensitive channel